MYKERTYIYQELGPTGIDLRAICKIVKTCGLLLINCAKQQIYNI